MILPSYGTRTDAVLDSVVRTQAANRRKLLDGLPDRPNNELNMILCELVVQVSRLADATEQLAILTGGPLHNDVVYTREQS